MLLGETKTHPSSARNLNMAIENPFGSFSATKKKKRAFKKEEEEKVGDILIEDGNSDDIFVRSPPLRDTSPD